MKNRLFCVVLFFSFISVSAKEKVLDQAYLRCHYQLIQIKDTLKGKTSDDLLILQIGRNISKCQSFYSFQIDSLMALPDSDKTLWKMINKAMKNGDFMKGNYPHKRMKTYVYKNYPQGKMTVTDGLSLQDYMYEDELHAQEWQMTDSTKTILDYTCQQAVCDFRGRYWTAWFAPDIPVNDGPWKFGGLPGLIMEVYDQGHQYHFTIVGLQQVDHEPIIFSPTHVGSKKFEQTNRIDFLKAKKRYLMDMNGYIQMETGIDLSNGELANIMRYDLMELDYK